MNPDLLETRRDKPDKPARSPREICDPKVISAMKTAWAQSSNDSSGVEAGFRLDGKPANYNIVSTPFTNQQMAQTTSIIPGVTFDVFHVHPNKGDPKPSANDMSIADKYNCGIFTISSSGLYEYDPGSGRISKLRDGLDWSKPCTKK